MSDEYLVLETLIDRLEQTPLMDRAVAHERHEKFMSRSVQKMLDEDISYGQASDKLDFYSLSEANFKAEIRRQNDSLIFQVQTFNHGLDQWFQYGESHPPYFPWRIAVILSKRKEIERERRFLAAYCRHFKFRAGTRDQEITKRAIKKGAISADGMPDKREVSAMANELVRRHGLEARNVASQMRNDTYVSGSEESFLKYDLIWTAVCNATVSLVRR